MKEQIDELAALMSEFHLEEARLKIGEFEIEFSRCPPGRHRFALPAAADAPAASVEQPKRAPKVASPTPAPPIGTPISSPMMGIFYISPSPGSPPFVKEGDSVSAGQVVGLIEAMKVFNEITSPVAGSVKKMLAESGQLVQPGAPLMYVG